MIDVLYIVSEDANKLVKVGTPAAPVEIFEGMPLKLTAAGLEPAAAADTVFGVAKNDVNSFHNYAVGELAAYGTGKLTVVKKGTVRVKSSVYGNVEVTPATDVNAPVFTKALYAATPALGAWTIGDVVYVNAAGAIDNGPVAASMFGKVTATPDAQGWLEIEVDCPTTAETAKMA